jgi:hypothetical protein
MTALVFALPAWHYYAFPLVVQWQAPYEALDFYFPNVQFGLLENQPDNENFTSLLQTPRTNDLQALKRDYQPGELSQWQAYLNYLLTQADQDEIDFKALLRGQIEPVLPKEVDRELLWSLAYHLEQMLAEEAAGLQRLAGQQQALTKALGEDVAEETDLGSLNAAFNPPLIHSQPDPTLARVRYQFWRQVLKSHLQPPWATLVLESAAGESSPRYIWEADAEEGQSRWQASFILPDWRLQAGSSPRDMQALQLGVEFQKNLGELLHTMRHDPAGLDAAHQKMQRLGEERLWPESGLPQAHALKMEIYVWLKGAEKADLTSEPMVFLSPAD